MAVQRLQVYGHVQTHGRAKRVHSCNPARQGRDWFGTNRQRQNSSVCSTHPADSVQGSVRRFRLGSHPHQVGDCRSLCVVSSLHRVRLPCIELLNTWLGCPLHRDLHCCRMQHRNPTTQQAAAYRELAFQLQEQFKALGAGVSLKVRAACWCTSSCPCITRHACLL
jgi:hypothetical protein